MSAPTTLGHTAAVTRVGHALADPTRTRILLALRGGPAQPSALAAELGVTRQVMSNQLSCLRGCGLVTTTKEGRSAWYTLADPALAGTLDDLLRLTLTLEPDCCTGTECRCC